ncbi:hypothetical protein Nmel_003331 [Mimus melanotis]
MRVDESSKIPAHLTDFWARNWNGNGRTHKNLKSGHRPEKREKTVCRPKHLNSITTSHCPLDIIRSELHLEMEPETLISDMLLQEFGQCCTMDLLFPRRYKSGLSISGAPQVESISGVPNPARSLLVISSLQSISVITSYAPMFLAVSCDVKADLIPTTSPIPRGSFSKVIPDTGDVIERSRHSMATLVSPERKKVTATGKDRL